MKYFKYILLFFSFPFWSQTGGESVFAFLNLPTSARQAALGGSILTLTDDVNQPNWNPATINANMDKMLALNYVNFLGDINFFSAGYAYHFNEHFGTIHSGLSYMNYGNLIAADQEGTETGTFKAYDLALSLGYGYQLPKTQFFVGANLKLIQSKIEAYNAMGIAGDFGIMYYNPNKPYIFSLVVRNLGKQLVRYEVAKEKLPMQIQAGMSYQLEHVPIRLYTTLDNLQKWQLAYANPSDVSEDLLTGEMTLKEPTFFNNALRHLVIGAELFPDKGFSLRIGYNVQRAQELKMKDIRTFAGLSFGFGLKVKSMKLNYAYSKYHPASNSHNFSVNVNLK